MITVLSSSRLGLFSSQINPSNSTQKKAPKALALSDANSKTKKRFHLPFPSSLPIPFHSTQYSILKSNNLENEFFVFSFPPTDSLYLFFPLSCLYEISSHFFKHFLDFFSSFPSSRPSFVSSCFNIIPLIRYQEKKELERQEYTIHV